jgi:hypothetical protein
MPAPWRPGIAGPGLAMHCVDHLRPHPQSGFKLEKTELDDSLLPTPLGRFAIVNQVIALHAGQNGSGLITRNGAIVGLARQHVVERHPA